VDNEKEKEKEIAADPYHQLNLVDRLGLFTQKQQTIFPTKPFREIFTETTKGTERKLILFSNRLAEVLSLMRR
jgi:hypothetical protein